MLGYSQSKIAAKAVKRGITVEAYTEYLVQKRATRNERKRAERARLASLEKASKPA